MVSTNLFLNVRVMKYAALSFVVLFSPLTNADSVRCGNKLVYVGDSLYTVKSKCGEPDDMQHRTETRKVSRRVTEPCPYNSREATCSTTVEDSYTVEVDELTYDFGSTRFIEVLHFENGKLMHITDGDYGKKQTE